MPHETQDLSHFAAHVDVAQAPADIQRQLNRVIADTLAAVVGGSVEPELRAMGQRLAHSSGPAVLPGLGRHVAADAAAMINGSGGTFLEMDEGNRFSRGHPAVHVLPAVLALCQERQLGLRAFLNGVLAGYEVGSRIGAAAQLRASMHPHGTWGTVGAAAGCARALGLDSSAMHEVINISTSLTTASSKKTMLEGGLVRNVYAGLSNRNGLLALQLFESGFGGERHGIESIFGEVVSERIDLAALVRGLGSEWHIAQNYFKLHACCRYNHGTLDAVDAIAAGPGLPDVSLIERIEVATYNIASELIDPAPRNTLAAKFSVPFAVATRLVHGHSQLPSFTWEAVRNPAVLALAQKVVVREDRAMNARLPHERPAHVRMLLTDGSVREAAVGVNRGDDASPYTDAELHGKFMSLCTRVWSPEQAQLLYQATVALSSQGPDQDRDWSAWCQMLAQAPLAALPTGA